MGIFPSNRKPFFFPTTTIPWRHIFAGSDLWKKTGGQELRFVRDGLSVCSLASPCAELFRSCEWVSLRSSPQTVAMLLLCLLRWGRCGQWSRPTAMEGQCNGLPLESNGPLAWIRVLSLINPPPHLPAVLSDHKRKTSTARKACAACNDWNNN